MTLNSSTCNMADHILGVILLIKVNLIYQLYTDHGAMSFEVDMNKSGTTGYKMKSSFIEFKKFGYIECAKECRSISGCVSINYDRRQLTCGINLENDTDPSQFIIGDNYVFSLMENWTENFFDDVNITCDLCRKAVLLSSGQRVCIDLGSEVAAWTEVAQGKQATLSYTHTPASNAVNGIKTDLAMTYSHVNPFWRVDLGDKFYIKMVRVYLYEHYAEYFRDINIKVGLTFDVPDLCAIFVGPGVSKGVYDIKCRTTLRGRYVAMKIIDNDLTTFIAVSEVEIYSRNIKCP